MKVLLTGILLLGSAAPLLAAEIDAPPVPTPDSPSDSPADVPPAYMPDPNQDQRLYLEVFINGQPTHKIVEFVLRHGRLLASADDLGELGLRIPADARRESDKLIVMGSLPYVHWELDQRAQALRIFASDAARVVRQLRTSAGDALHQKVEIESGSGFTMNYDALATFSKGQRGGSGSLDARWFSPHGVVSGTWLGFAGESGEEGNATRAIRLDTAYSYADVNTLRRYTVGDFITTGLSWSRLVHLEGAQLRSDFSMRPDLVTIPMPTISGSAVVPTTVNVLSDGNLIYSQQVGAGPFEISQLPVISGAGNISMTMTNAMGQQIQISQPFYSNSTLLAPGLHTYGIQGGVIRKMWGQVSDRYGEMAGTGYYRRGITDQLTLESTAETTTGMFMAGGGVAMQWPRLGFLGLDAAVSDNKGSGGYQLAAQAQRNGRRLMMGASATIASRNYFDLAAKNGVGVVRKQISGFGGVAMRRYGSINLGYSGVDQDAAREGLVGTNSIAVHSKIVTANYSVQVRRLSFYTTEYRDLEGSSNAFQAGLNISLKRRRTANISGTSSGQLQMQTQQTPLKPGDWGYQGYVQTGSIEHQFAEGIYKSKVGQFTVGVDHSGDSTLFRAESQGAISFADKHLFASNTIYDSFAIVDTNPVHHVTVLQENRDIGSTGSAGLLLVPDLRAFDGNHLSISAENLPEEATVSELSKVVRPQDRSGIVVRFPIRFNHSAILKLADKDGKPLPLGSGVWLKGRKDAAVVGYDGAVYLEDLEPKNDITVTVAGNGGCVATFEYRPRLGAIPTIGPARCVEKKP